MAQEMLQADREEAVEEFIGDDTPTAQAMYNLRRRIYDLTVGPGAVTRAAEMIDVDRGNLSKVIQPSMIRNVARLEREIGGGDSA